jgi:hypothetical protein
MGTDSALNRVRSAVFNVPSRTDAEQSGAALPVRVIRGRAALLAMQGRLIKLSRITGQSGAMDWLNYFVSSPDSLKKTPYLLLMGSRATLHSDGAQAEDIEGAVLVYEYRVAGVGTHVFATDDVMGLRTVVAPAESRVEVAQLAIRKLMEMGAVAALISVDHGERGGTRMIAAAVETYRLGWRRRTAPRYLALLDTVDETLATLGAKTRRNFRSYRRRAELELGTEFVPEVQMGLPELREMNRRSTNPADDGMVAWHYSLLESESARVGTMFCGVRAADGRWLSLIGGRRHGNTTEIDWQMNLAGLPHYSLSTVMRAYLLEHETARGTRQLMFEGGTPHPMRHSFASTESTDVVAVRRWSVRGWVLRKFSRWLFPRNNFLGAALRDDGVAWK